MFLLILQHILLLIVPYNTEDAYQLSLVASPLASYLNIPIIIYDNNQMEILEICNTLNVSNAFVIGDIQLTLPNISITALKTIEEIQDVIITTVKNQFSSINYITLTNPSDTIQSFVTNYYETAFTDHIKNIKLTILGKEINILGTDVKQYNISIPNGINQVKILGNIIRKNIQIIDKINPIDPIIYMFLYDPWGNLVAYSNSLSFEIGKALFTCF